MKVVLRVQNEAYPPALYQETEITLEDDLWFARDALHGDRVVFEGSHSLTALLKKLGEKVAEKYF